MDEEITFVSDYDMRESLSRQFVSSKIPFSYHNCVGVLYFFPQPTLGV